VNQQSVHPHWRVFFITAALEAGAAFLVLASIPSEDGVSSLRLGVFSMLFLASVAGIYLGLRPPHGMESLARPAVILAVALLALAFGLILFFLRYLDPARLLPYYTRLSPVLWFVLVVCVQSAFFLLYLRNGLHPDELSRRRSIFLPALAAFAFLVFVFALVAASRLGLTPDPAYWGEPGVPILGWQFALALLGGLVCLLFSASRPNPNPLSSFLLPFSIWLIAVLLWLSVPMNVLTNSFYVAIDPPDYQPYPYSDAGYYDSMAHSLLIGRPYQGEVPTRPLYIVFLAGLHLLFGENYSLILSGQTFVLALIPVVLFWLGAKLHSRAAGVTVALFAIFREYTSLLVSSETRVSNTRTLLVDLPTFLFLSVACLFALRWLERRDMKSAFLAGGTFGIFLLLRTQSILVLPFLFAAALLAYGLKNRQWVSGFVFFLLGLVVTVSPWLVHNYVRLGQFTFDAPFQYKVIASQYAYSGNLDIQNYDFEDKSLARVLVDFALKDPAFVFGFIANHFLAGEVDGLLALPLIEPYHGIGEPVNMYWMSWRGDLQWYNSLVVILYLAVIAFGLAAAWRRWRWAGLLPLAFNLGYALATAVGRFSGWRYDLPVDWVPYFYFGIGFVEIAGLVVALFGGGINAKSQRRHEAPMSPETGAIRLDPGSIRSLVVPAILFAFLGALPWLAELPGMPRYTDDPQVLAAKTAAMQHLVDPFLRQPQAVILEGRLLYPRFFSRGRGMSSTSPWPSYAVRDYPRLGFVLLNQELVYVVLPARANDLWPSHGVDVVVVGCQRAGYVEARMLVPPDQVILFSEQSDDGGYTGPHGFDPCLDD
jgi:hypothetical protein